MEPYLEGVSGSSNPTLTLTVSSLLYLRNPNLHRSIQLSSEWADAQSFEILQPSLNSSNQENPNMKELLVFRNKNFASCKKYFAYETLNYTEIASSFS